MASAAGDGRSLDKLFAELHELTFASPFTFDTGRLYKVIDAIHKAPQDENEKLRKKDQTLVNDIDAFVRNLETQDHMPLGTIKTFVMIAALLIQIEGILWELKRIPGPPPMPEPPQPPQPPTPTRPLQT